MKMFNNNIDDTHIFNFRQAISFNCVIHKTQRSLQATSNKFSIGVPNVKLKKKEFILVVINTFYIPN